MSTPDWSKDEVLKLISLYERETELWDLSSSKHKRCNAIDLIAEKLNRSFPDVEKKINCIRSQYFREKAKITKSMESGAGSDDVYCPKWYAYNLLSFLSPAVDPVKHFSSLNLVELGSPNSMESHVDTTSCPALNIDNQDIDDEDLEVDSGFNASQVITPKNKPGESANVKKRRLSKCETKVSAVETKLNYAYEMLLSSVSKNKDENDSFGDYVAQSIRKLNDGKLQSWVKHQINDVLYQAECVNYHPVPPQMTPLASNLPRNVFIQTSGPNVHTSYFNNISTNAEPFFVQQEMSLPQETPAPLELQANPYHNI